MSTVRNVMYASILTMSAAYSGAAIGADSPSGTAKPPSGGGAKTVVLVHGAFADGSSWSSVIPLLQAKGLKVVAVQNPLTSLSDDVQFAKRAIDAQSGPVILVGHSWGGTVISEAGTNDKVKALVYVAAFAPSSGQSTSDTGKGFPVAPGIATLQVDASGFASLPPDAVRQHFAQDVSPEQANLIATTQGLIRAASFDHKVSTAAWLSKPSWYIVAKNDHMIPPDQQRAMAKKINARTTELPASHVPMLSRPQDVANVIVSAAESIK
ncbi:alpha/beta fold hydrolase [Pendulispora albinea]|uniref:Alpha/beta hydrolase n=1 Tax=Pendulispora albinea TaxID=2741071 RepID=A0ABZ2LVZ8_9BACT